MVASEEEKGVGVVDLQSPQVQHTLRGDAHTHKHTVDTLTSEESAKLAPAQ